MNYMDLSNWAKALLISIFLLSGAAANAQRLKANNGKIAFTSDAPLELIEASTQVVGCLLDPLTREFAFSVQMASFKGFNSALQRQHFNENYIESDKFPKGTFNGKIIEEVDLSVPGTYTVRAKGKLSVHGIPVERIIRATVVVTGKQAVIKARFDVPLEDHKIAIPRIVNRKIAEVIDVKFEATLKP
jgi:polyisoprenoid-binding protein YceI